MRPIPNVDSKDKPHRRLRRFLFAGASLLAAIAVGGAVLYGLRAPIGSRLAVAYLARRGLASAVVIDRLDRDGFVGHVQLGPADDPDLTVDRIEAVFEPAPILDSFSAPRLRSLRLIHPRLKASYDGRRLRFGALQPLIDQALSAPPGRGPGPSVTVEQGELRLASFAGFLSLTGDAVLDRGRIRHATAHIGAARLAPRPDMTIRLHSGDASAVGDGEQLDLQLDVRVDGLDGPANLGPARGNLVLTLPYGRDALAKIDGPVKAEFHLQADRAAARSGSLRDLVVSGALSGTASGSVAAMTLDLSGQAKGSAARVETPGDVHAETVRMAWSGTALHWRSAGRTLSAAAVRLDANAGALSVGRRIILTAPAASLTLTGLDAHTQAEGWRIGADPVLAAKASRLSAATSAGRIALVSPSLSGHGRADIADGKPPSLSLAGSLSGIHGGLDPDAVQRLADSLALVGDPIRIAAALRDSILVVPSWSMSMKNGDSTLRLGAPVRLAAANGVAISLTSAATPLAAMARNGSVTGGFAVALSGQGVPDLKLAVGRYRLAGNKGDADLSINARSDGALWRQASVDGAGRLTFAGGVARFDSADCLAVRMEQLGTARPALAEDLSARLCPDDTAPMASIGPVGWSIDARIDQGGANLPVALSRVSQGEGRLTLTGRTAPASGRLELTHIRAVDTAPDARFQPVTAAGALDLTGADWRGRVQIRDADKGRPLAVATVRQSATASEGQVDIDATALDFTPKGLQPIELSPLAAMISKVDAHARFNGKIAWNSGAVTSGGRFAAEHAAFGTPVGLVSNARVDVVFSSLLPPVAGPGQGFAADAIAWIAPLTHVAATFALTPATIELAEAHATLAHGGVGLGPLSIPFADDRTLDGVLTLKQVDLGELIAGSNLADSVSLQARIDGTVPFNFGPMGVRLKDGVIVSVGAGRLSIKRQALTGAVATAGAAGAQPNAIQDFAYQALENLAFDSLDARIASRPQGRLGAVFHIKGRNDPPKSTDSRIGLIDLIRGHAFDKPIDLPKGTPIDLTLDTSLNFDELLKAYGEIGKTGSAAVQP